MSGLSSSCQRARPQWERCELDQGDVGHEALVVGDGEQVRLGLGMVGHGAMRALDRPALLSGSCSCFVFFARREQQRH